MSLEGKLVSEINIKCDGDVFHEIFRHRPHHISTMSSDKVQNVDIHEGEWGTVGSVIFWNFTHGKPPPLYYTTTTSLLYRQKVDSDFKIL